MNEGKNIIKNYLERKRKNPENTENSTKSNIKKIQLIKEVRENIKSTFITKFNINKLITIDNTNPDIVSFYLNSLKNLDKNKKKEIQFLKFVLPPNKQEEFVNKGYFEEIFDAEKELINLLNTFIKKNVKEIEEYINKKLKIFNSINIKTLYLYLLNYDYNENKQLFLFHLYYLIITAKSKIQIRKYYCENIFNEYIKYLNTNKIFDKNEILYLILILTFALNEKENIMINRIFESIETKNKFINKINKNDENIVKIDLIDKKIIINKKDNYNFDEINFNTLNNYIFLYTKEEIDYYIKYYFYSFKKIQEDNFFFFNKKMKNYYLEHLRLFLVSNLMKNCYYKYQYEYDYNNETIKLEYLFEKKDSFEELKSHLFFFPFLPDKNILKDNISGLTNKQSLDIYIFIYPKLNNICYDTPYLFAYEILNAGFFVETLIHEVPGNYLYNYYYYNIIYGLRIEPTTFKNNKNKIYESFKEEIPNINNYDGGNLLEVCLFGDKINKLYFWGALFLLSSNLYENFNEPEELRDKFMLYNNGSPSEKPKINYKNSSIIKEIFAKYDINVNDEISIENMISKIPKDIYISTKGDNNDLLIEFEHINDTIS